MKKNKQQRREDRKNKNKTKQMKWRANMNKNQKELKSVRNGSGHGTEGFTYIEDKAIVDTQFFVHEYFNHPNNRVINKNFSSTTYTAHEVGPGNIKKCFQMGPAGPAFMIDEDGKFYMHHENFAYVFKDLGLYEFEYKNEDDELHWFIYTLNLVLDGFIRTFLHHPATDNEWKYKFLDRYTIPMSTRQMQSRRGA